jgi:CxxC motif-containing protein
MKTLDSVSLKAPVKAGQVVVKNVCGTGVNIISTRSM